MRAHEDRYLLAVFSDRSDESLVVSVIIVQTIT
jgi:hypothetical protein